MRKINHDQVCWCRKNAKQTRHRFVPSSIVFTINDYEHFDECDPRLGEYFLTDEMYNSMPQVFKNLGDGQEAAYAFVPVQIFQVPVLLAKTNKIISILVMAETLDEAKQSVLSVHGKDVQRLVE